MKKSVTLKTPHLSIDEYAKLLGISDKRKKELIKIVRNDATKLK